MTIWLQPVIMPLSLTTAQVPLYIQIISIVYWPRGAGSAACKSVLNISGCQLGQEPAGVMQCCSFYFGSKVEGGECGGVWRNETTAVLPDGDVPWGLLISSMLVESEMCICAVEREPQDWIWAWRCIHPSSALQSQHLLWDIDVLIQSLMLSGLGEIKLNLLLSHRAIWETSWCISWPHHNL